MTGKALRFPGTGLALAGLMLLAACGHGSLGNLLSTPAPQQVARSGTGGVAILLPYGDTERPELVELAASMENSARLAVEDLGASGISLKVYETRGTVEGAAAAAQAALDDGAELILGPVFKDAALETARIASQSDVPVFSFSNDPNIVSGNLFVLGHTFENSADRILQFAMSQGRGRVLSVHALNQQGLTGQQAIADASARTGAEVKGSISYEFSQIGVVESIAQIVDTAALTEADIIVFTADTAGALSLLGQLLPEAGIDTEKVKFAGLTRWDIPASNLSNKGLQGGWFPLPDPNLTASYGYRYQYTFDTPPHPLAGLAYDGVVVANSVLATRRDHSRVAALKSPSGFIGATGPFRFRQDGRIERSLAVAEVRGNRPQIIAQAPRSFTAPES